MNRVEVFFEVDEQGKGRAALAQINEEQITLEAASASSSTALSAAAQRYEQDLIKAGVASSRAREEAIKYGVASVESAQVVSRSYAQEAQAAELSAAKQKAAVESLQRQRSSALLAEFKEAEALYQKDAQRFIEAQELKKRLAGHKLTDMTRFDETAEDEAGGIARSGAGGLRGQRAALRAGVRATGLPGEVGQIGGLGLYGGGFIAISAGLAAIDIVRNYVDEWKKAKEAEREAQEELVRASTASGANLQTQIEIVQQLKAEYKGLSEEIANSIQAQATLLSHLPVTEKTVSEAGKSTDNASTRALAALPPDAAAQAALTIATLRDMEDKETLEKSHFYDSQARVKATRVAAEKALENLRKGNTEPLLGISDEEVQARFAGVINKRPSEFTEQEKMQARLNELIRQAQPAYVSAADAASRYGEVLSAQNKATANLTDAQRTQLGWLQNIIGADQQASDEGAQAITQLTARSKQLDDFFTKLQHPYHSDTYLVGLSPAERLKNEIAQVKDQLYELGAKRGEFELLDAPKLGADARAARLKQFDEAERELTDKQRGYNEEQARLAEQKAKELAKAVLTARDALRSHLEDLTVRSDKDNDFTAMFIRFRREIDEVRKSSAVFGKEFVEQQVKITQAIQASEAAQVRFNSQLTALKYLQEARRLEQPFVGLTGAQERREAVVGAQITDVLKGDEDRLKAYLTLSPYKQPEVKDEAKFADYEFRRLQAIDTSGTGRAGKEQIAEAVIDVLGKLNPQQLTQYGREQLAAAYTTRAGSREADIKDAIERERAGASIQKDAREQLALAASATDLTREQRVKEFLATTQGLSDKELTGDLRIAREQALRESARLETGKAAEAEARSKTLGEVMDKLNRLISEKGIKVDSGPAAVVNIKSIDGATQSKTLGPAMTPDAPDVSALQRSIQF